MRRATACAAVLSAMLALPARAPAQDAPPDAPPPAPRPVAPPAAHVLGPDEAAWIDDTVVITLHDFDAYLGTIYARLPEGEKALRQVLEEAIVQREAAVAGVDASEDEVSAALGLLDSQARAAGGGSLTAVLTADVDLEQLREVVRLHVLQDKLVRAAQGLPPGAPVDNAARQAWLEARVGLAELREAPLDDPRAAVWAGGRIDKEAVGARLRAVLAPDTLAGVLTEMIGVQVVRRHAAEMDIDLTPAEVTREVLQRDAALKARAGGLEVNYAQFLDQIEHRTLQETIQSDKFTTEVLLRLVTERLHTEDDARAFWERHRAAFDRLDAGDTWEQVRLAVWKEVRQRTYKDLLAKSRIVRRY